jgi:hypothetical protein
MSSEVHVTDNTITRGNSQGVTFAVTPAADADQKAMQRALESPETEPFANADEYVEAARQSRYKTDPHYRGYVEARYLLMLDQNEEAAGMELNGTLVFPTATRRDPDFASGGNAPGGVVISFHDE